jgi:phosphoglycerate dehydrogenase-like enzyme
MNKAFKVAILISKPMAYSVIDTKDYQFLSEFADVNSLEDLPDKMTLEFMEKELIDADACITCWGTPSFTDDLLAKANKLKLIAHAAGSIKKLVPKSFWSSNCRITSNAQIIAEDVAQTTLALILCSLRHIWDFAKSTREGEWKGGESGVFTTRRLDGLQVGIIGGSNVGREVIKILKPFNCSIKLYDPFVSPIEADMLGVQLLGLEELIKTSDVLTLHAPAVEEARHIINEKTAPLIKDGAIFVNTARGMLVDEAALIKELQTGRIFACIDVTDPEPPAVDHPFRSLPNVILTPHIAGGHTVNGRHMLGRNSIKEVYNYLKRGLLQYEVREQMLDYMA